jgi:SAM-dependent methyltransferase
MLRKTLKLLREMNESVRRMSVLEQRCHDNQVELRQMTWLLGMTGVLPAIPPKDLQIRVAGVYKPRFFEAGQGMIEDIEELLRNNDCPALSDAVNILDFGCGCGRLMIPLSFRVSPGKVTGTDIDPQAITWLKSHYPSFKDLDVNGIAPPTKYSDASFDFIYGVSVFTHLPEDMQQDWLKEMARIMKPGGLGLFTTHGERHFGVLAGPELRKLMKRGFYYKKGQPTAGLPKFYRSSFQTKAFVEREWGRWFEIIAIRENGIGKNQDAVLVRKRMDE